MCTEVIVKTTEIKISYFFIFLYLKKLSKASNSTRNLGQEREEKKKILIEYSLTGA